MEFKISLQESRKEALNTKTFIFSRPQGFDYLAGQYVYLTLPYLNFPDERGDTRHFTLSSSPTEKYLAITVRLRHSPASQGVALRGQSGFKQTLDSLPKGAELSMRGPNGDFVLGNYDATEHTPTAKVAPQIFIAGGIGVTPFRSIIKYVTDSAIEVPIMLLCSNFVPEEIPFKKELDNTVKKHENLEVIHTITKPKESCVRWDGLAGRVDGGVIKKLTSEVRQPTYWLCGPPAMVTSVEDILEKMGIPEGRVKVEKFTGY